jgi:hypothetical protein
MIQDKARHIRQLTPANRGAVMKAVTKNVIPARAEIHGKRPIFGDSNAAQSRASLKSVALKVVVGGRLRGHDGRWRLISRGFLFRSSAENGAVECSAPLITPYISVPCGLLELEPSMPDTGL